MTKAKNYDEILKCAFQEYVEERLESNIYRDDEFETSKNFEKKMSKMLKSENSLYHKVTLTKARKVICILVAILILLLSSLSVGAVREFIADFFVKSYSDHDTLTAMLENKENYPTEIKEYYEIGYVPKGYTLASEDMTNIFIHCIYADKSGNDIVFSQETTSIFNWNIDNEHSKKHMETRNGQEYVVYISEYEYIEMPRITIFWNNGKYIFSLSANLPKETMFDLCDSLKIKKS